jgi:predicted RecB family nuclease
LKQITPDDYTWLSEDMFKKCKARLTKTIGPECETARPLIEKTVIHQSQELEHESIDLFLSEYFINTLKFRFTARADLITQTSLWEIKCVREITMDHQLQVVIYAWLLSMKSVEKEVKIYNIRTGEIQQLDATKEELDYIVISLLQGKYQQIEKKTDAEFVEDCRRIIADA